MRPVASGLAGGLAAALVIAACTKLPTPQTPTQKKQQQIDVITSLWTQIRGWRREAHMELDPAVDSQMSIRNKSVKDAERVCPDAHEEPKVCGDVCSLASAICDNAETICDLSRELADEWARDKCTSATASCKEAKQRCCKCADNPPQPELEP